MFELAMPWIFVLLPFPLVIWFFLPRASLQLSAALKVPFFNAMLNLNEEKRKISQNTKLFLPFMIWFLLLLAMAGPRWVGEPRVLKRESYNIMLVLDVSPSMGVSDMVLYGHAATRLAVVKQTAKQFIQKRVGDKVGLILFGERAYLLTPLTYDRHNVVERIDDVTVGLAGKSTSIGDALGLAIKRLQNVPKEGRMVILLTDGVNNSGVLAPLKAAELARDDQIKVYTIGLGSDIDPQTFNGMFMTMNGAADLDEDTLKAISKITGGRYFRATDTQSLQHIYDLINQMAKVTQDQATIRPQHDYYPWPLALAFFLFLYMIAQRSALFKKQKAMDSWEILSDG